MRKKCQYLGRKYVLHWVKQLRPMFALPVTIEVVDSFGSNVDNAGFLMSQSTEVIDKNVKQTNLEPRLSLLGLN